MPDDSPILSLPYILPSQAQKHVTHNEALRILDAVVQLTVWDRTRTAPPPAPQIGDRHLVAAAATGPWAGQSGRLALWETAGWAFFAPNAGWQAHVLAEGETVVFDGTVWKAPSEGTVMAARLGVSSTPDATNRLSVSAAATLLNHAGAGHQLKLNKAAAADTASLMFQTGFSGRAEMGTAGSDDFAIKVSANGSSFLTALSANATTGVVAAPQGMTVGGAIAGLAVTQSATDATAGRLLKVGDAGLLSSAVQVTDFNALTATGFYHGDATTLVGRPGNAGDWLLQHVARANTPGGQAVQIALSRNTATPRLALRIRDASLWTEWVDLYSRVNILGPVSQTAGVPTGAVIERGSNANGEFVRFADGTLICTRTNLSVPNANTALGGLFRSANVTWTYPAVFVVAPAVVGDADDADCWVTTAGAPTATAAPLRVFSAVTKAAALNLRATAVGRWF